MLKFRPLILKQKTFTNLGWIILGVGILGNMLDWIGNAIEIITPRISLIGTFAIALFWIIIMYLVNSEKLSMVLKNGEIVKIKTLRGKFHLPILGVISLLWLPRLFENPVEVKAHPLGLSFGGLEIQDSMTDEMVYSIPYSLDLDTVSYIISYLPIYISNKTSKRTIENLTIGIWYPTNSSLSLNKEISQNTFGPLERNQMRRRVDTLKGRKTTFFHLDKINAKEKFYLAEPIQFLTKLIKNYPLNTELEISISGKDIEPIICKLVIFSKWEADNTLFNESISKYYKKQGSADGNDFTLVISEFALHKYENSRTTGYISFDPMRIKTKTLKVNF